MPEFDVVVIGGGILGLATARQLLRDRPQLKLLLVEKEAALACHQTGHNSGVVHSGIYYAPGSLKAQLCVAGKRELEAYAAEQGIQIEPRGKLIVALDEAELPRLAELERRAVANGVSELQMLGQDKIADVEPYVRGIRALWAPRTGVIDYQAVVRALAGDIEGAGGEIALQEEVVALLEEGDQMHVGLTTRSVTARLVVACAGLQADRVAGLTATRHDRPRIIPFRGDYYTLRGRSESLVRGLVYPVPDPAFPFLGVHFTRRVDGSVLAGPNAVLAFARERYRRLALNPRDVVDVVSHKGLWLFAGRHLKTGAAELWRDLSKRAFVRDMQRYIPEVSGTDVVFGPMGIRAQAMDRTGHLLDDFVIEAERRTVHVVNAPSPAATSSFAIGRHVAELALQAL
jgi:L-2-hydroxyglutarate oxidase LhgO